MVENNDLTKYVDSKSALARVRGNEALYRRMLGLFLSSGEFAGLDKALNAGDYSLAANLAHAIKGISGNLSLGALFEASGEMTTQLRSGAPEPGLVAEYRDALEKTRQIVSGMLSD